MSTGFPYKAAYLYMLIYLEYKNHVDILRSTTVKNIDGPTVAVPLFETCFLSLFWEDSSKSL